MSLGRSLRRNFGGWKKIKRHCFWCGELIEEGFAFKHLRLYSWALRGESIYGYKEEVCDDEAT